MLIENVINTHNFFQPSKYREVFFPTLYHQFLSPRLSQFIKSSHENVTGYQEFTPHIFTFASNLFLPELGPSQSVCPLLRWSRTLRAGWVFHHWTHGLRLSLGHPCPNSLSSSCQAQGRGGGSNSALFYFFFFLLGNSQTSFNNQMPVYSEAIGHHPNIYWSLNTLHEVIFNYLIKPEQGSGHVSFDDKHNSCSYY